MALPADFPADRTLAVVAFQQRQQSCVDRWIDRAVAAGVPPTTRGATGPIPAAVVEVPVLSTRWRPVRRFIDGGMTRGIGDPDVLHHAAALTGSRVRRWFSARNRAGSSLPPVAARCGRRGARHATGHGVTRTRPLPDLGLVEALTAQHRSLAAVRSNLVLSDHLGPVARGERAPDRTRRRVYDELSRVGLRLIPGPGRNELLLLTKPVSRHHPPRWTRGLRGVSQQPDREGGGGLQSSGG